MTNDLAPIKYVAIALLLLGLWLLIHWALNCRDTALWRFVAERASALDRRMRLLLWKPRGRLIVLSQLGLGLLLVLGSLLTRQPQLLSLLLLVIGAPTLWLELQTRARRKSLEGQLDAFTLALANAMRATPSIGRALSTVAETVPSPMREELQRALHALRVGSSLDDVIAEMGARIHSSAFDAILSALLIGQRVGGNVPEILDETGMSLREIARLKSTMRAKTADGRVQGVVMGAFPLAIVFLFNQLMPGYFEPLTTTPTGLFVLAFALMSWLAALLLARKILAVQL